MECPKCKEVMIYVDTTNESFPLYEQGSLNPIKIVYTIENKYECNNCGTQVIEPEIINYYPFLSSCTLLGENE